MISEMLLGVVHRAWKYALKENIGFSYTFLYTTFSVSISIKSFGEKIFSRALANSSN